MKQQQQQQQQKQQQQLLLTVNAARSLANDANVNVVATYCCPTPS